MARKIALVLIGLAVVAGFVWAFRPEPVPVDLAEIGRGALEVTIDEEGVTRIREVYVVSAPVPGRMLRANREVGDLVHRGDVVAVLEPQAPGFLDTRTRAELNAAVSTAEAALRLAQAEVRRAQAELAYWRSELDRQEALRRSNTISQQRVDQTRMEYQVRQTALDTAMAQVEVRQRELDRARAQLIEPVDHADAPAACCMQLTAPVDGRVLAVPEESAHVVQAGEPLISVGDPADLEIVVDLLSSDAVRVPAGAKAHIEQWGGEPPLDARVRRIEPVAFTKVSALGIEEQRVRVELDIDSPPEMWRGLGHDYRVMARIVAVRRENAMLIPMGALFRDGADWAAFEAVDGRARLRRLKIGPINTRNAVVEDGLAPGAKVIVHPSDRISDGVAIEDRAAL